METALANGVALLEIRTDSKYTIKCKHNDTVTVSVFNEPVLAATEWIPGWKKNNWIKKTDSKPVMNQDLMMKIDDLQKKVKLKWVGERRETRWGLTDFSVDLCSWSFVDQRE